MNAPSGFVPVAVMCVTSGLALQSRSERASRPDASTDSVAHEPKVVPFDEDFWSILPSLPIANTSSVVPKSGVVVQGPVVNFDGTHDALTQLYPETQPADDAQELLQALVDAQVKPPHEPDVAVPCLQAPAPSQEPVVAEVTPLPLQENVPAQLFPAEV